MGIDLYQSVLEEFFLWLGDKKVKPPIKFIRSPFADFMQYDAKTDGITFNIEMEDTAGVSYTTTVLIHEAIHGILQGVRTKSDVKKLKRSQGEIVMRQIDVESDLLTFHFLRDVQKWTWTDWLGAMHDGALEFADDDILDNKFNRWVSSMVSIYSFNITGDRNRLSIDVLGPGLRSNCTAINYDGKPISKYYNFHLEEDNLIGLMKLLYQNPDLYSQEQYIELVTGFCHDIFGHVTD